MLEQSLLQSEERESTASALLEREMQGRAAAEAELAMVRRELQGKPSKYSVDDVQWGSGSGSECREGQGETCMGVG